VKDNIPYQVFGRMSAQLRELQKEPVWDHFSMVLSVNVQPQCDIQGNPISEVAPVR
jgi:hypothetical protein